MVRSLCKWYCAVLLWLSGSQHASNPFRFYATILDYQLVPELIATLIAATFPLMFFAVAAALMAPGERSATPFIATAVLAAVFVGSQIAVVMRKLPVDCGCFGGLAERRVGAVSVGIAMSLLVAAIAGSLKRVRT